MPGSNEKWMPGYSSTLKMDLVLFTLCAMLSAIFLIIYSFPAYQEYIIPRARVSCVFLLNAPCLESNPFWSDQSCLYSGRKKRSFTILNSVVNVTSFSFCAIPVLTPFLSSKYSPRMVALKKSVKSYLAYPATPYHLDSFSRFNGSFSSCP